MRRYLLWTLAVFAALFLILQVSGLMRSVLTDVRYLAGQVDAPPVEEDATEAEMRVEARRLWEARKVAVAEGRTADASRYHDQIQDLLRQREEHSRARYGR